MEIVIKYLQQFILSLHHVSLKNKKSQSEIKFKKSEDDSFDLNPSTIHDRYPILHNPSYGLDHFPVSLCQE